MTRVVSYNGTPYREELQYVNTADGWHWQWVCLFKEHIY